jgi:hypothetical protein
VPKRKSVELRAGKKLAGDESDVNMTLRGERCSREESQEHAAEHLHLVEGLSHSTLEDVSQIFVAFLPLSLYRKTIHVAACFEGKSFPISIVTFSSSLAMPMASEQKKNLKKEKFLPLLCVWKTRKFISQWETMGNILFVHLGSKHKRREREKACR